jgi:hypothetical protein
MTLSSGFEELVHPTSQYSGIPSQSSTKTHDRGPLPTVAYSDEGAPNCGKRLEKTQTNLSKAVMGCVTNGSCEAEGAGVGIDCGKVKGAIFRGREVVGTVSEEHLLEASKTQMKKV